MRAKFLKGFLAILAVLLILVMLSPSLAVAQEDVQPDEQPAVVVEGNYLLLGVMLALGVISALLAFFFGLSTGKSNPVEKVSGFLGELEHNTGVQDLIETFLKGAVPATALSEANKTSQDAIAALKMVSYQVKDSMDKIVELSDRLGSLVDRVTDGEPNVPPDDGVG